MLFIENLYLDDVDIYNTTWDTLLQYFLFYHWGHTLTLFHSLLLGTHTYTICLTLSLGTHHNTISFIIIEDIQQYINNIIGDIGLCHI